MLVNSDGTRIPWQRLIFLQTLKVFLSCVLAKRYAHPSSAIIAVLAGLDRIDPVFTDFVSTLDAAIRTGDDCMYCVWNLCLDAQVLIS